MSITELVFGDLCIPVVLLQSGLCSEIGIRYAVARCGDSTLRSSSYICQFCPAQSRQSYALHPVFPLDEDTATH